MYYNVLYYTIQEQTSMHRTVFRHSLRGASALDSLVVQAVFACRFAWPLVNKSHWLPVCSIGADRTDKGQAHALPLRTTILSWPNHFAAVAPPLVLRTPKNPCTDRRPFRGPRFPQSFISTYFLLQKWIGA